MCGRGDVASPATAILGMPAAVARSVLDAAEFVVVIVWTGSSRQQRRVATLASRVPVPNHPDDGNARCLRQMRTFTPSGVMHKHTARPTVRPPGRNWGLLCRQRREGLLIIARRPAVLCLEWCRSGRQRECAEQVAMWREKELDGEWPVTLDPLPNGD
jgi:hypothetical protein